MTVGELAHIEQQVLAVADALAPAFAPGTRKELTRVSSDADGALASYRDWLAAGADGLREWEPIGERGLARFLHEVALVPHAPSELLGLARLEHA